jgi:hypothetical protein
MSADTNSSSSSELVKVLTYAAPKLIYGTIALSATIAPLRDPPPRPLVVIAVSVTSLFAIAVASSYSEFIRYDMAQQRQTSWREKKDLLPSKWLMTSALVPIFWFGLSMTGVLQPATALDLTKISLILILAFFGFIARRLCGGGWLRSLASGLLIAAFGTAVVQAKVWAKYLLDVAA